MTISASFSNLFVYSLIQSGLPQSGRQKAQGSCFCILVQTREQQEKCSWSIRGCWFLQLYRATGTQQLLNKPDWALIHTLPVWHTKVQVSPQAHPKQVPERTRYPAVSEESCAKELKQVLLHMGTPCYCSFTPPWSRWSYPNNTSKRCAPIEGCLPTEEIDRSFCSQEVPCRWSPVPGPEQPSPLHQAVGGSVSVWPTEVFL